jgi:4-amino-4-deoxy-L-arabinose transferase-like glycosyltransferase
VTAPRPLERTRLGVVLVALAAAFILTYVGVALVRLRYPFALEWIEGGLLDEVRWILAGHKPYVAPSLDYVPFIYNPLYFWVSAVVAKVVGPSLFALRLVSLSASLGSLALLALLVRKETGSNAAAVVGAGLFASTFKLTEQFMDLARVDSLYVLFAVLALYLLRTRPTLAGELGAAASLVLCFLTKQTGTFVAAPLVGWVLFAHAQGARTWRERLGGVPFAASTVLGIAGSAWLLDRWTDGWYRFYAFELPSQHRLVDGLWVDFWSSDLMGHVACACIGALFVLLESGGMDRKARGLWAAALLGVLLASWSARLHDGGWNNVIMPAFALLSALLAIALHRGFGLAAEIDDARQRGRVQAFVLLLGIVQLALHAYDPRHVLPKSGDEEAGRAVVATLASAPGDVFVPTDSYLAAMAGKSPYLHEMAVRDLTRATPCATTEKLVAQIKDAFATHRWPMVITDNDWFAGDVVDNYARGRLSVPGRDAFFPVAGLRVRPGSVFTPK